MLRNYYNPNNDSTLTSRRVCFLDLKRVSENSLAIWPKQNETKQYKREKITVVEIRLI